MCEIYLFILYTNILYSSIAGIVINNYLFQLGKGQKGQKYNLHIQTGSTSADMLMKVFKLCPAFPSLESMGKFWLPLEIKILKLGRRQDDLYSQTKLIEAKGTLEFPDILEGRRTFQDPNLDDALPNTGAINLQRYAAVLVKFTLHSWSIGGGGISATLKEVIIIDDDMAPLTLYESSIEETSLSPSKRRKVTL